MRQFVKIAGEEHEVRFARFRSSDPHHNGRDTVVLLLEQPYEDVKARFAYPGQWSVVKRFDTGEPDMETDCAAYEKLCSITDRLDGVLEVVMGKATDAELLRIILGAASE